MSVFGKGHYSRILAIAIILMLVVNLFALFVSLLPNARADATITITKIVDKDKAFPGEYLNYTIYFSNTGDSASPFMWINDTLPNHVTYINDNASDLPIFNNSWSAGRNYYFTFNDTPPNSSYYFLINVMINLTAPPYAMLDNIVQLNYTNASGTQGPYISNAVTTVMILDVRVYEPGGVSGQVYTQGESIDIIWNIDNTTPLHPTPINISYGKPGIGWTQIASNEGAQGPFIWNTSSVPCSDSYWINVSARNLTGFTVFSISNYSFDIDCPIATFQVTKTVDKAIAVPGEYLNYTIYFNNTGTIDPSIIWINDTLPEFTEYVSDTNGSIGGIPGPGQTNWTFTGLPIDDYSFNIIAKVLAPPNNTWLNNTLFFNFVNSFSLGLSTTASTLVSMVPIINVDIVVDKPVATKNDILNYTIYYNNTGNWESPAVLMNVTLPANLSFIDSNVTYISSSGRTYTWEFYNVGPGTHSIWFTAEFNGSAIITSGQQFTTKVALNYTDVSSNLHETIDTASTAIGYILDVDLRSDIFEAAPGSLVTYSVEIEIYNPNFTPYPYIWLNFSFLSHLIYQSDTIDVSNLNPYLDSSDVLGNPLRYVFKNLSTKTYTTFTFNLTFEVDVGTPNGTMGMNWVSVHYSDSNGDYFDNVLDGWTLLVIAPIIDPVILSDKTVAKVDDYIIYTIFFNNSGGEKATTVWINFTAPGLTYISDDSESVINVGSSNSPETWKWIFTDVALGTHYFNVETMVDPVFLDGDILSVQVLCDYAYNGILFAPSSALDQIPIKGEPQIDFAVTLERLEPCQGMQLPFNIRFNNTGNAIASFLWINLSLPPDLSFVGDTINSVTGVVNAETTAIGYWAFEGVGIGAHNFTLFLKADIELPDGIEISVNFSTDYTDAYQFDYVPIDKSIIIIFKRPVINIMVEVSDNSPEPGQIVTFVVHIDNVGSVDSGQVIIELSAESLVYVDDNASSLNGIKLNPFRYSFSSIARGNHSFQIVVVLDNDVTSPYINSTFRLDYSDPTGAVTWNATRTIRLIPNIVLGPSNGWYSLIAFPLVIGIVIILGLSSILYSENSKYWFLTLFIPLYTKLKKKKILEHETRGLIRGYIIANPGDHFNSIKKSLDLNNGTLAYHLQVLEREGLIKSRKWGKYTRFYPSGMKVPENGSRYSEIQRMIIDKIRETQGITQKEIANMIGVTKSTINYHVNKLVVEGVVEGRRLGIQIRYFYKDKLKK